MLFTNSELLLKRNIEISLVVKNIYLYFWSTLGNLLYIAFLKPELLDPANFFRGWDYLTINLVMVGALCEFSTGSCLPRQ